MKFIFACLAFLIAFSACAQTDIAPMPSYSWLVLMDDLKANYQSASYQQGLMMLD